MEEIWKDIKDYEGVYQVSNMGNVRSLDRQSHETLNIKAHNLTGRLMKACDNSKGYKFLRFCKNGRSYTKYVHRLVAETFIPNPDNKPQVNHKDMIKSNNNVDNLEWMTSSENIIHGLKNGHKRTRLIKKYGAKNHRSKAVGKFDLEHNLLEVYGGTLEAERETGICHVGIIQCCNNEKYRKTAGGFIWEYV